jgi:hypothetical protein
MKPPLSARRIALALLVIAVGAAQPSHAFAASCKQASTCEEAVVMWCGGYSRADGDGDGIPCENVCHSLEQVQKIKKEIGC